MSTELLKQVEPRVIQVFFNGEAINIQTNASLWSEIVPLIKSHENGFNISGKKAVLGSSKGVLQLPDAIIPPGNQAIFLVQDKMKSGASLKTAKPLEDESYVDLRRLAKHKEIQGLGSNPTRQQLIDALNETIGIKAIKGASKIAKEKKEVIVKEVKTKIVELRPELEERIASMEILLGTMIEGFGGVLDVLRGRKSTKNLLNTKTYPTPASLLQETFKLTKEPIISNKVKTTEELQAEFNNIKFS